jgi:hypothetical protein
MNDIDPRMAGKLAKLYEHIDAQAPPSRLLSFQPDEHGRRRGLEVAAGAVGILVVAAAGVGLAIGLSNHHGKPVGVAAPSSPTPTVQATATPSATVQPTPSPTADPTVGWKPVSNPAGAYSFRVPSEWAVKGPCVNPGQAPGDTPMDEVRAGPADLAAPSGLGITPGLAGCGGDFWNGFIIRSFAGSVVPAQSTPGGGWACFTVNKQDVVIAGIHGTRNARLPLNTPNCFDLATVVEYDFTSGGRVYEITFQRNGGGEPDLTSTLDTMMAFSWAFHG